MHKAIQVNNSSGSDDECLVKLDLVNGALEDKSAHMEKYKKL